MLKEVNVPYINTENTHHIEVSQSTDGAPEHRASLDGLDPHSIGEEHTEDGNPFIIIGARHGTGDVSRHNGDHSSCYQTSSSILYVYKHSYKVSKEAQSNYLISSN